MNDANELRRLYKELEETRDQIDEILPFLEEQICDLEVAKADTLGVSLELGEVPLELEFEDAFLLEDEENVFSPHRGDTVNI